MNTDPTPTSVGATNPALVAFLRRHKSLPQRQDSITAQLEDGIVCLRRLGLPKAAHALAERMLPAGFTPNDEALADRDPVLAKTLAEAPDLPEQDGTTLRQMYTAVTVMNRLGLRDAVDALLPRFDM